MNVLATAIDGVVVVRTSRAEDARGNFARLFCEEDLAAVVGRRRIVQINHSVSAARGTVRGMHFQSSPHAEMKLVRCMRGKVWDVALDLRAGSRTFLQWHAEELSAANDRMLVIPEGCAHGFQVLDPGSELLYLHTAAYSRQAEGGVNCRDPLAGISWPLPVEGLSVRDEGHPLLRSDFKGLQP